jgi:hypothetical protein
MKMEYAQDAKIVEQNESQAVMSHLHRIRGILGDARGSSMAAADKIVGAEPAKLQSPSQPVTNAPEPPPQCFMHGLGRLCNEMERLAEDINIQLNRLHRSF